MYGLIADVGSTHCRFALTDFRSQKPTLLYPTSLHTADYPSFIDAAKAYLGGQPGDLEPRHATFAVAGPVGGDTVKLTNHSWTFSVSDLRTALGLSVLRVINDFVAVSLSVAALEPASLYTIGPSQKAHTKCFGVIGPGTGLGMGALITVDGAKVPLASEGGHASFAPTTEEELKIASVLMTRFGHVSNERILSGPGLSNLYHAVCAIKNKAPASLTPSEISHHAVSGGDGDCAIALEHFCAILGAAAGDLALLLCAEAIFIAGGIAPNITAFLESSKFRARFESKGRFREHMRDVTTHVITEPNPGLYGAAFDLAQAHNSGALKCP